MIQRDGNGHSRRTTKGRGIVRKRENAYTAKMADVDNGADEHDGCDEHLIRYIIDHDFPPIVSGVSADEGAIERSKKNMPIMATVAQAFFLKQKQKKKPHTHTFSLVGDAITITKLQAYLSKWYRAVAGNYESLPNTI